MDDFEMELKYSTTGTPFIEMFSFGRLIFSRTLMKREGYNWLCYVRRYSEKSVTKNATTGERSILKVPEFDAIMYNFKLYRGTDDGEYRPRGVKRETIPLKIQKWLRKQFENLCIEIDNELYFPHSQLDTLYDRIENTDFTKMF